jgi:hypothetical protein
MQEKPQPLNSYDVRSLLPEVGDERMEIPTVMADNGPNPALPCKVVYVNRAHLWYMVEFENGFRESYKVPKLKTREQGGIL